MTREQMTTIPREIREAIAADLRKRATAIQETADACLRQKHERKADQLSSKAAGLEDYAALLTNS